MNERYADMLYLPHHVSPTRQPLSMRQRAAQFSPFAALDGYDEAIQETARATAQRQAEGRPDSAAEKDLPKE